MNWKLWLLGGHEEPRESIWAFRELNRRAAVDAKPPTFRTVEDDRADAVLAQHRAFVKLKDARRVLPFRRVG